MASHLPLCRRRLESPLGWLLKWPNWLSLDAPLIAVTWQALVAGSLAPPATAFGPAAVVDPAAAEASGGRGASAAVLFLTVWLIYAGDRLLDVRRFDFAEEMADRHRFVGRWSAVLWPLWWSLLAVDVVLAIAVLEAAILASGAALFAAVAVYALLVHGPWRWPVPKELIVGTVFAVGTCLPVIVRPRAAPLWWTVALLAGLFVLNCLCVAAAQQRADRCQQLSSAMRMFPGMMRYLYPAAIALAISSLALLAGGLVPATLGVAVSMSGCGLAVVSRGIVHADSEALRGRWSYWADPVLLSPLLVLGWMEG